MTMRQAIVQNIRQYRTVPAGSLLWLDIPGADDLIEVREINSIDSLLKHHCIPDALKVHLDTPDGDFEDTFLIDVGDLKSPPALNEKPNRAHSARQDVISRFGRHKIESAEHLAKRYALLLLERYRVSHGYTGPEPRVWIRWHTKVSWGGMRGITISPGYLYQSRSDFFGFVFSEYSHIRENPVTGNFTSLNRLNHVKALVAHELAHFLQRHAEKAALPHLNYRRAHGDGWQYIYGVLRADLNRYINR